MASNILGSFGSGALGTLVTAYGPSPLPSTVQIPRPPATIAMRLPNVPDKIDDRDLGEIKLELFEDTYNATVQLKLSSGDLSTVQTVAMSAFTQTKTDNERRVIIMDMIDRGVQELHAYTCRPTRKSRVADTPAPEPEPEQQGYEWL